MAAEKVYLCTGVGDYVPTYDPLKNKFGCMARSLYLEHRLKVLVSQCSALSLFSYQKNCSNGLTTKPIVFVTNVDDVKFATQRETCEQAQF